MPTKQVEMSSRRRDSGLGDVSTLTGSCLVRRRRKFMKFPRLLLAMLTSVIICCIGIVIVIIGSRDIRSCESSVIQSYAHLNAAPVVYAALAAILYVWIALRNVAGINICGCILVTVMLQRTMYVCCWFYMCRDMNVTWYFLAAGRLAGIFVGSGNFRLIAVKMHALVNSVQQCGCGTSSLERLCDGTLAVAQVASTFMALAHGWNGKEISAYKSFMPNMEDFGITFLATKWLFVGFTAAHVIVSIVFLSAYIRTLLGISQELRRRKVPVHLRKAVERILKMQAVGTMATEGTWCVYKFLDCLLLILPVGSYVLGILGSVCSNFIVLGILLLSGLGDAFLHIALPSLAMRLQLGDGTGDAAYYMGNLLQAAVLDIANRIEFPGVILEEKGVRCISSFPGRYPEGWGAVTRGRHRMSVACVFLTNAKNGLGKHTKNHENGHAPCFCSTIYGERSYKQFGYLIKYRRTLSEPELMDTLECAAAMNAVAVAEDATEMEMEDAEAEAKRRWEASGRTAAWGCEWFARWVANIHLAVSRGQRLTVFYFDNQVGRGKIPWDKLSLSDSDPWDGIGLGGSQKCEVAYLDRMRKERGPEYDYEEVDVYEFLRKSGASFVQRIRETNPADRNEALSVASLGIIICLVAALLCCLPWLTLWALTNPVAQRLLDHTRE